FLTCRKEFLVKLKTVPCEALMRKAFHGRLNKDMKLLDMLYFMNEHDLHHIESIKNLIQLKETS
ncbi:MAG: DinB family protein, partial [Bacteroidia bacterium]|nr:DinB family protein [Bacteroidia bacterium]